MDNDILNNGVTKMTPLISFDALVDTDIGLVKLIQNEYLNQSVFDINFFNRSLFKIIHDIYYRKEENLLYLFAKERNKKLDEYYSDFLKEEMDKILDLSVITGVEQLLKLFDTCTDIIPTILCYSQKQIDILNELEFFRKYEKVLLENLTDKAKYSYTQYYFKLISEAENFLQMRNKTIYFSTCARNLDDSGDDIIDSDLILSLAKQMNQICLFDLYEVELLE